MVYELHLNKAVFKKEKAKTEKEFEFQKKVKTEISWRVGKHLFILKFIHCYDEASLEEL